MNMSSKDAGTARTNLAIMNRAEYEVEIHYEKKLRQCWNDSASPDGTIQDEGQWDVLIAMFYKHRLISLENGKVLDKYRPCFPIEF